MAMAGSRENLRRWDLSDAFSVVIVPAGVDNITSDVVLETVAAGLTWDAADRVCREHESSDKVEVRIIHAGFMKSKSVDSGDGKAPSL